MNIDFIYPKHYDLIFHVMAYMKVNNASDLYDVKYIEKMAEEKVDFSFDIIPAINSLQEYYNENFERLMLINFLPFYCTGYDDMKNNFLSCNRFTQDDIQIFIKPFIEILDNESVFFYEYWNRADNNFKQSKQSTEEKFKRELEKYSCVFNYFNKPCQILFSYIITKNGRGLYSDSHFAALVKLPKDDSEFYSAFFQLLHEYTHSFTDSLLNKNINMKDGSHNLSEYVVILADYFLIKAVDEKNILKYFAWIKDGNNEDLDEEKFLTLFNIDENLKTELMKLINNILELHT